MLLRRRASFADCLALRVAFDCAGSAGPMPVVFCSRYGEVHRSVEMLEALSKNEPFSPMNFGLSVHNAPAALYSIARGDTSPTSAVAAGRDSLPEGVLEACGVLSTGAPRVLLVAYDDSLPEVFGRYADEGDRPAALGTFAGAGSPGRVFAGARPPRDRGDRPVRAADRRRRALPRARRPRARALERNPPLGLEPR